MAAIAVTRAPSLLKCSRESWLLAIIDATSVGLDFSGVGAQGYLVPFWSAQKNISEAKFIPGYNGLKTAAYRNDRVLSISEYLVHENDTFELHLGSEPRVIHRPSIKDYGMILGAYMIMKIKNAPDLIEWMTVAEINKIRDCVINKMKGKYSGPWNDEIAYPEMCRKTVVRRGCKHGPSNPELERLLAMDDALYVSEQDAVVTDVSQTSRERFEQAVAAKQAELDVVEATPAETINEQGEVTSEPRDELSGLLRCERPECGRSAWHIATMGETCPSCGAKGVPIRE